MAIKNFPVFPVGYNNNNKNTPSSSYQTDINLNYNLGPSIPFDVLLLRKEHTQSQIGMMNQVQSCSNKSKSTHDFYLVNDPMKVHNKTKKNNYLTFY
jgi:hypothetical protein